MKRLFLAIVFVVVAAGGLTAQNASTDSVDVLHYDLRLDIGHNEAQRIKGSATLDIKILRPADSITLELYSALSIDSVLLDGMPTGWNYSHPPYLRIANTGAVGDTITVSVHYNKQGDVTHGEWGGFYFSNNIYYNLGISIYEYPHNCGKTWFPCRDNFYDKASYHLEITAPSGWKAICSGLQDSVVSHDDGSSTWCWTLAQPVPTYLVGVAVAPYHIIERSYTGLYGTYPATLGFLSHDSTMVANKFNAMEQVIPMFERCFGPYRWDRVGYVATPRGSMEHASNVAFTTQCMASSDEVCQTTMAHEFAHAWFGNLITCATSYDMWINEGGASFCEEIAVQAMNAGTADSLRYKAYADEMLLNVLCNAHISDDGFKPLYGQDPQYTYGTTVYKKGATVWHSLRGYMGDSLFYASMTTLFDRFAFGNLDSWQLRDTLSAISGMDLTDFFDFHVFNAGFVDYDITTMQTQNGLTTIGLKQKVYGTTQLANGNRVHVTFFSPQLDTATRLVTFDGESTTASFALPFEPLFATVNYDKRLSLASLYDDLNITAKTDYEGANTFFTASVRTIPDSVTGFLHVTHHLTRPDSSSNPGIVRMAKRYWSVKGIIPSELKLKGFFHFTRMGTYATLDNDLFNAASFDSVALMYRPDNQSEWTLATQNHAGSSSSGSFVVMNLKLGEYTLAVIDKEHLGIASTESAEPFVAIYPNPTSGQVRIETDLPGETLTVTVKDMTGRTIKKNLKTHSGETLSTRLKSGTYLFVVQRDKSHKQSQQSVVVVVR